MSQFHNFQSALSVAEKREPRMEPHVRVKHIMRLTLRATFFERFVSKPFCLKRNYAPSPSGGMHIHHTHISALSKFALRPDRAMSCVSVTIWRREYCISLRALADQKDNQARSNSRRSCKMPSVAWIGGTVSVMARPGGMHDTRHSTVSTAKMCYPCVCMIAEDVWQRAWFACRKSVCLIRRGERKRALYTWYTYGYSLATQAAPNAGLRFMLCVELLT
ncbi:hypothetical protein KCU94_g80, partial [Aureobasidium melanogenum]